MSNIAKVLGQRIRNYRLQRGISQEKLAELSGCHPTYIGQIERGEKNATIESVAKITTALNVSMSSLFEKVDDSNDSNNIPLMCYELISTKNKSEQEKLYKILMDIDNYKQDK